MSTKLVTTTYKALQSSSKIFLPLLELLGKFFPAPFPFSPSSSGFITTFINSAAWLVSLFKTDGILQPHLKTRPQARKCLLLCLKFTNYSIKTSHNRGQINYSKVVSYCCFRGMSSYIIVFFFNKALPLLSGSHQITFYMKTRLSIKSIVSQNSATKLRNKAVLPRSLVVILDLLFLRIISYRLVSRSSSNYCQSVISMKLTYLPSSEVYQFENRKKICQGKESENTQNKT